MNDLSKHNCWPVTITRGDIMTMKPEMIELPHVWNIFFSDGGMKRFVGRYTVIINLFTGIEKVRLAQW